MTMRRIFKKKKHRSIKCLFFSCGKNQSIWVRLCSCLDFPACVSTYSPRGLWFASKPDMWLSQNCQVLCTAHLLPASPSNLAHLRRPSTDFLSFILLVTASSLFWGKGNGGHFNSPETHTAPWRNLLLRFHSCESGMSPRSSQSQDSRAAGLRLDVLVLSPWTLNPEPVTQPFSCPLQWL